jgi:hypothetical protein
MKYIIISLQILVWLLEISFSSHQRDSRAVVSSRSKWHCLRERIPGGRATLSAQALNQRHRLRDPKSISRATLFAQALSQRHRLRDPKSISRATLSAQPLPTIATRHRNGASECWRQRSIPSKMDTPSLVPRGRRRRVDIVAPPWVDQCLEDHALGEGDLRPRPARPPAAAGHREQRLAGLRGTAVRHRGAPVDWAQDLSCPTPRVRPGGLHTRNCCLGSSAGDIHTVGCGGVGWSEVGWGRGEGGGGSHSDASARRPKQRAHH